jgi:undecaprenyl diphosphate synthase
MPLVDAYAVSMGKLEECLHALYSHGVTSVSIYMLSKLNLQRSQDDLEAVDTAESLFLETVVPAVRERWELTVRVAGDLGPVPPRLRDAAVGVHSASPSSGRNLFLCIGYDPYDELLAAQAGGRKWSSKRELLADMWVSEEIDLVIRTGGALTLSNFVPLQAGYARIVFLDELFNDTTSAEFLEIVKDQEQRRFLFGK